MKRQDTPFIIKTISEQHRLLGLPKPLHPQVSIFRFSEATRYTSSAISDQFMFGYYCISIKKNFPDKLKYGQKFYDFNEGILTFVSPNQVLGHKRSTDDPSQIDCICLLFHPQFLKGYELANRIKKYGFFSYASNEALHLSGQEEIAIEEIMHNIEKEYKTNIDHFSQDVMVAQIELLLQYSNRFYNRQFITRKVASDDILIKLEKILDDYFEDENRNGGLPTVQYLSSCLYISPNYLSDLLRSLTGQTTQQHIHSRLIDKAKELLSTTSMTVNEIAYQLGFDYPQSFNKLFKKKTEISPIFYRRSFK